MVTLRDGCNLPTKRPTLGAIAPSHIRVRTACLAAQAAGDGGLRVAAAAAQLAAALQAAGKTDEARSLLEHSLQLRTVRS